MTSSPPFHGYPELSSNTTYTPNQFFDVVLPNSSRGVVRLVAYLLRKTLGWSDLHGNPQEPQVRVSWREFVERAGIARSEIGKALEEATKRRAIRCLQAGRPHSPGAMASSALYELCWDEREEYITDPREFQGFFAGNGNLTYIPNAFLDYTVPNEPLSVIRVVGAIIRHTIGFRTKYGFRRQQVEMSFTELQRRTRIASRRTLSLAIQQALEHHHLLRMQEGVFDARAGRESRPATYCIRWADVQTSEQTQLRALAGGQVAQFPVSPEAPRSNTGPFEPSVRKGYRGIGSKRIPDRFEKDTGETVGKGDRNRFEKETGKRSEKDTGIEITPGNNTEQKQQQHLPAPPFPTAVAAGVSGEDLGEVHQLLTTQGFTPETATFLCRSYPEEQIRRQCQWLPRRKVQRNRLGLLRRAIEEDWPEPTGTLSPSSPTSGPGDVQTSEQTPPALFAAYAYAGWAGSLERPVATPSAGDVSASEPFVARLLGLVPDEARVPQWGREFGAYVRRRVQTSEHRPQPAIGRSVAAALRNYGDEFYQELVKRLRREEKEALHAVRRAHEERYAEAYREYLRVQERELRELYPEVYARFVREEARVRDRIRGATPDAPRLREAALQAFDREQDHLERFSAFLLGSSGASIADFWSWDAALNPERFDPRRVGV